MLSSGNYLGVVRQSSGILLFDSKETTFEFGSFRTISGYLFGNYIIIFKKT